MMRKKISKGENKTFSTDGSIASISLVEHAESLTII